MASPAPSISCMYVTDPVTGCDSQRPCDSCLEKPGCMVGVIGACQPLGVKADDPWHYSRAKLRNLTLPGLKDSPNASAIREKQDWEFPSVETKYCPSDDAVCRQCIQERFWLPAGVENDSRYCVGANGCVCIYNCEFNKNALETVCPRSPEPTLYTDDDFTSVVTPSPSWPSVPPSTTTLTTPAPVSTPTTTSTAVVVGKQSNLGAVSVVVVIGCVGAVACFALIIYCWYRRWHPKVPMAVLIKADTPNDTETIETGTPQARAGYHRTARLE